MNTLMIEDYPEAHNDNYPTEEYCMNIVKSLNEKWYTITGGESLPPFEFVSVFDYAIRLYGQVVWSLGNEPRHYNIVDGEKHFMGMEEYLMECIDFVREDVVLFVNRMNEDAPSKLKEEK